MQEFSDDSSIVGCITDKKEEEYRELIENFVWWCGRKHFQLNIGKSMEQVVDFWHRKRPPTPVFINREEVEMMETLGDSEKYTELVKQHWGPLQEGTEQAVFSEDPQVFQCMH